MRRLDRRQDAAGISAENRNIGARWPQGCRFTFFDMKRLLLAAGAGLTAIGAVTASAATLGGITQNQVGVDSQVIGACDTNGIATNYNTSFDATSGKYQISGVALSGVNAACDAKSYKMTITKSDGTVLGIEETGTLSVSSGNATISIAAANRYNAELASSLAIAISG